MIALIRFMLLSVVLASPAVAAYAAFDEVLVPGPRWLRWSRDGVDLAWRVRRVGALRAAIDVVDRSGGGVAGRARLPFYQADATPGATFAVPAAGDGSVEIDLARIDQLIYEAAVELTLASGAVCRLDPNPDLDAASAYGVTPLVEDAGWRADLIAYTAQARDERTLDLHVKNFAQRPIHLDLRVPGWQAPDQVNPRLHLLPGRTLEVLLPIAGGDARSQHAMIDAWDIRVGDDHGAARSPEADGFARFVCPIGWMPLMVGSECRSAFNPNAVAWRADGAAIALRNLADVALSFDLSAMGGGLELDANRIAPRVELAAGGSANVELAVARAPRGLMHVLAELPLVAGAPAEAIAAVAAPTVPERWLPVTPRHDDARFNPLGLGCVIAPGVAGMARVRLINFTAADVHADIAIAGYQDGGVAHPRAHVPAGEAVDLELTVVRIDARLALAKLLVWNVRVGDDVGATLCAAPH